VLDGGLGAQLMTQSIVDLRTALLDRPLGLEDRQPTFSWRMQSDRRGARQRAFRILVSSSCKALAAGRPDLWDSGWVESNESVGIRYAGIPLVSRQLCYWTVMVSDDQGREIMPSDPSSWEMGLLYRSDWTGAWIAAEDELERDDRTAGMTWVGASSPGPESHFRFRLPFVADADGRLLVTIVSMGAISTLSLDETSLPLPICRENGVASRPAVRVELPVAAGSHRLGVEVSALPAGFLTQAAIGVAAQIRVTSADGRVTRLTGGWEMATDDAGGTDWAAARPLDNPPNVPWPAMPARLLRRRFDVRSSIRFARLYVAALGSYEMRLNGDKISTDCLSGESTDFRHRVLYRVHDVTNLIARGENILGAILGDGWYASYQSPVGRYAYGPAPRRLLAQLELTYADNSREVIATDEGWRADCSAIQSSEIYNGEDYDARLEQPNWDRAVFDDKSWKGVWPAPAPDAALVAQTSAPIRALRTVRAIKIIQPSPGIYVFDFGQNFAGWARLTVQVPAGRRITLRFAERLRSDGHADQSNLRAARGCDVYVARGVPAGETHEPRFTYHGFRYVQVEGLDGPVCEDVVEGVVAHTDLVETGIFRIDSPLVQKLWLNTLWSQRSNFVGIPTDCPQRDERLGWGGDAQVFWDAASFNMDVAAFTRRYANDLRDAQSKATGAYALWSPMADTSMLTTLTGTPGWADVGVVLPWTAFMRYGDRSIVDENWEAMTQYVGGILHDNRNHLWRKGRGLDLGDWLALDAKHPDDETTPKELIATALLAQSLDQLAEMGGATGREREATVYREHARHVRDAFANAYVKRDGTVGNGSQTSYILALRLNCVPHTLRSAAAEKLCADIRRRGTLLSTGFLGTPFSLDAIADCGEASLVYDLLLRTDFPSWGYMIAKGATTVWERWNGDVEDFAMNSLNHYALGAVCGFLYRRVAGIDPVAPGFSRVRVKPLLDQRVRSAGADYDSVRGRISVNWVLEPRSFSLELTIPANSRGVVHLPSSDWATVTESDRPIEQLPEIQLLFRSTTEIVLEVGSGTYVFAVRT